MPYGTVNADVIGTSVAGSNIGAGNASIMKNRIINGDFKISQYNGTSTASVPAGGAIYAIDRFGTVRSTTGTYTVQQSSTAPSGFAYSYYILNNNGNTPAAGDFNFLYQRIEGYNIADLGWGTASAKTVTLSFQIYASATGTYGGSLRNSAGNRSYPFSYTVSSANTWTSISVTVAGDTSGTWLTTNGCGIEVDFDLGSGSTFRGTAGSWSSGSYIGATSTTQNPTLTTNATFYITGVQLEVGSSATGYEYRQYGQELALCQRYYAKTYDATTAPATATKASAICAFASGGISLMTFQLPVNMRSTPTVGIYSPNTGAVNKWLSSSTDVNAATNGDYNGTKNVMSYSNSAVSADVYCHMTASAEL